MSVLVVDLAGIALIALIAWYFWFSRSEGVVASITSDGMQEAFIVVKGGYSPDTIQVDAGRPVRLVFNRQESDPCTERVLLDSFGMSADLHQGRNVVVQFTPSEAGTYEFACQMGMIRGKVVAR